MAGWARGDFHPCCLSIENRHTGRAPRLHCRKPTFYRFQADLRLHSTYYSIMKAIIPQERPWKTLPWRREAEDRQGFLFLGLFRLGILKPTILINHTSNKIRNSWCFALIKVALLDILFENLRSCVFKILNVKRSLFEGEIGVLDLDLDRLILQEGELYGHEWRQFYLLIVEDKDLGTIL